MARLLEMRGISKSFPGVRALADVGITLDRGEVLGIVGENGAGKSTLMKILAGVYRADQGELAVEGQTFAPRGPRDALAQGIIVIHQELAQVPDRSIAENIFLGHLPRNRLGLVRRAAMKRAAAALMARVGLHRAPGTRVRQLGIAEQQLVEIARALSRAARVIVMDEPTATLTQSEVNTLFATVRSLLGAGVGVIFISHHLEEIFQICDRVAVLRDGHSVATRPTAEWTEESLVQAMVDRPLGAFIPKQQIAPGGVLLEVSGLSLPGRFSDVSFSVRAGEILGFGGLIGAGRTDVLKAIFGALPGASGSVRVGGQPFRAKNPGAAIAAGLALVPEDRKAEGLILSFAVRQNVALSVLRRLAWLRMFTAGAKIDALARKAVADLRIRVSGIAAPVRGLSGGNQQKVVLARALTTKPRIFLLDEPTRGIDVGAKAEVYRLIGDLAARGSAVVLVSSDMLELLGLCDRILVMRAGRVAGGLDRNDFSQERVMALAAIA